MIFFIITTCLFNDCSIRKNQYVKCINQLKKVIQDLLIDNYKIIIVENNGFRKTILDNQNCEVFYTENNFSSSKNKGYKELKDILDCIDKYNINDDDFIVKITGRYILDDNSNFMNIIKNINETKYNCVIRYGPYFAPVNYKMEDCITGLIGMSCKYIKQIEFPNEGECIEYKWGKVTYLIDDTKICFLDKLGINICPGSNDYFNV